MPEPDPLLGVEIDGRFTLHEAIGRGAMARVYRATQSGVERSVAVKIPHPELASDRDVSARFAREVRVLGSLQHPNLVQVFGSGTFAAPGVEPRAFLAMEWVQGRSLRAELEEQQALPLPRALHVALQICDAVGVAHDAGIVHRDIKPENVILTSCGADADFVKILDFGAARAQLEGSSLVTEEGALFGTARYVSPEVARGEAATAASDVYAIATVLYECLAGKTPFAGESVVDTLRLRATMTAPRLGESPRAAYVPPGVASVVDTNLARDPLARSPSARALGRALVDAATASGLSASDLVIRATLLGRPRTFAVPSHEPTRSMPRGHAVTSTVPEVAAGPRPTDTTRSASAEPRSARWLVLGLTLLCVALLVAIVASRCTRV